MVVKKKIVKTSTRTATAEPKVSLEETVATEEKRPAVTQVVEVVEDVASPPTIEVAPKPLEIPNISQEFVSPEEVVVPVETPAPVDEKRKEMVDELFQKKPQSVGSVMPEISIHTQKSGKPIYLWAIVVVVACVVAGVSLLFVSGKKNLLPSIITVPTPSATPTIKTTATPIPSSIKRSDITIQVLNGGGTVGAASKMKAYLEEKGYTVSETGNADSYTYENTEILVKSSAKAYETLLIDDLKGTYTLGTSSAALEDTVSFDARVIVGK